MKTQGLIDEYSPGGEYHIFPIIHIFSDTGNLREFDYLSKEVLKGIKFSRITINLDELDLLLYGNGKGK